ncbi:Uncharacterized protein Adt_18541 [Abeliophyllum distichum]|uniref:Uncharacterized protein n=1 Tax=Abeliophyllum distichum TaxID=126358 RepID=A0ABD1TJM5_9LAMI
MVDRGVDLDQTDPPRSASLPSLVCSHSKAMFAVEKIENAQRKVRCGSDRSTTDRCSGRRQWSVDHCSSGRPPAAVRPLQWSTHCLRLTAAAVDCSAVVGRPLQQWSTTSSSSTAAVVDPLLAVDRSSGRLLCSGRSTTAAVVDHQQQFDRCSGRPTACGRPQQRSTALQWSTDC